MCYIQKLLQNLNIIPPTTHQPTVIRETGYLQTSGKIRLPRDMEASPTEPPQPPWSRKQYENV